MVENVHKGTAVRREGDVAAGSSVRVSGCHDAVIYLLAPVVGCCSKLNPCLKQHLYY